MSEGISKFRRVEYVLGRQFTLDSLELVNPIPSKLVSAQNDD